MGRAFLGYVGEGLCFGSGFAAAVGEVGHGGCHEDGGEGAYDYTENHCEDEAADGVTTEDEDNQQNQQGGAGGHDCTTEGGVD